PNAAQGRSWLSRSITTSRVQPWTLHTAARSCSVADFAWQRSHLRRGGPSARRFLPLRPPVLGRSSPWRLSHVRCLSCASRVHVHVRLHVSTTQATSTSPTFWQASHNRLGAGRASVRICSAAVHVHVFSQPSAAHGTCRSSM